MQISLRLAELLRLEDKRPRGLIKHICDETGLERHQVSDLIHNRAQYVSLAVVAKLCDYLVEHRHIDPRQLPSSLFGRAPEKFWESLALPRRLDICLGVRHIEEVERLFVFASDSYLQGTILHEISGLADSDKPAETGKSLSRSSRQVIQFHLVSAPSRLNDPPSSHDNESVQREADDVYRKIATHAQDRALVCLGSMKVNPVVEHVLAHAFATPPFHSADTVAHARERPVPFMFLFRPDDPKPRSCCGGERLSTAEAGKHPGIYYEKASGKWECCPWDGKHDAALVFYDYRPTQGRLEMVLAGFSGRATQCLANYLRGSTAKLWPPSYKTTNQEIGAFIVTFAFNRASKDPRIWSKEPPASTQVITLDEKVIARRLAR